MEECKTKFLPKLIKQMNEKAVRNSIKVIDDYKTQLKKETDEEKKKELKKKKEFWEKMLKAHTKTMKNPDKQIDWMSKLLCNPGCVGTIFQEAELSDADYEKMFYWVRDNKAKIIKEMKKNRKTLKKGNKTMLKDSFYYKFDPKTKKRLIKEGALSGCVVGL
jgi:hypothetical protein